MGLWEKGRVTQAGFATLLETVYGILTVCWEPYNINRSRYDLTSMSYSPTSVLLKGKH